MSFYRTADRVRNNDYGGLRLRSSGIALARHAAPVYLGAGAGASSTLSVTVSWPGRKVGDLGILVIETSGNDATLTPAGWTHFAGSPLVDVADANGSKLQVLWRFADSDATVTGVSQSLADPGNHIFAAIYAFRGVSQDVVPGRANAKTEKATPSPIATFPSITTMAHNSLVICVASHPLLTASNVFSNFFSSTLTNTATAFQLSRTDGNGGGFGLFYGGMPDLGATGTATVNMSSSLTNCALTFALEPSIALPS